MEQVNKQIEKRNIKRGSHVAQSIVVTVFGIIEIVLAFRLIFKLLGANPINLFVKGIYNITQFFVGIFEGIFSQSVTSGAETTAIFEPATLIAMVVIAVIAWIVLKLMKTHSSNSLKITESTGNDNQTK